MQTKHEISSSNRVDDAAATTIVQERDYYSQAMLKSLWLTLLMAMVLYIGHWLMSWLSGLDTAGANLRTPPSGDAPVSATASVAIPIAASLAVHSILLMS